MKLAIYQVDAFTNQLFGGNPAAICPLNTWLPDELMQKIAMENNLAETAFYVKENTGYHIRWFTPTIEVDLCGHATLASAYVLYHFENYTGNQINFHSKSGKLTVSRNKEYLTLNFPADPVKKTDLLPELKNGFDIAPLEAYRGKTDYMLIFENEDQVKNLHPDFYAISKINARGLIVTAKGQDVDFVSRFFAPQSGIDEDPATGSAHTTLIPYWSQRLGKTELNAIQLSKRRGYFKCKYLNDRVEISGECRAYLTGEITVG